MGMHGSKSAVAAFAADPTSCRHARRFVRESLHHMGVEFQVIDRAVLVTSELVTNAVLHAHAGPIVTVHTEEHQVRIEVEDSSEMFPLLRDYGDEAVTGRGLDVVEAAASHWGVNTTQNGKTVWAEFEMDAEDGGSNGNGDTHGLENASLERAHSGPQSNEYGVIFLNVPVDIYLLLEQHHEALLREFELLMIGMSSGSERSNEIPTEVMELMKEVQPILSDRLSTVRPQVAAAVAAGQTHTDLQAVCSEALIRWTERFEELMAEAERLSNAGFLLTSPAPVVVLEMRRWFLEEMLRQYVDRLPPRPAPVFNQSAR